MNFTADNTTITDYDTEPLLVRHIMFYVISLLDFLSICCSLLLFYYFIQLRELRNLFSNQIIICLLFWSFLVTTVDIPLTLPFLYDYFYIATLRNPHAFVSFGLYMNTPSPL